MSPPVAHFMDISGVRALAPLLRAMGCQEPGQAKEDGQNTGQRPMPAFLYLQEGDNFA